MKKLLYFIFVVSITFFAVLNFLDYSNEILEKIENNKTIIEIEKPKNLTNEDFVNDLISVFKDMNSDIMYKMTDNSSIKSWNKIYVTNNTYNFLNLGIDSEKFNKFGKLSTSSDDSEEDNRIGGSTFFYNVSVYNFKEIEKYNLECCQYYIDNNMVDVITKNLSLKNYSVNIIHSETLTEKYVSVGSMALPAFLLFISAFFYAISKRKEIMCKKLMGYSNLNIILEDCIANIKNIILILVLIEMFNFVLIELLYKNSFWSYLNFNYKGLIIIILYSVIILLLANVTNLARGGIDYLKGKKKNLDIYAFTLITKIIFLLLLIMNLTSISNEAISIYSINKINLDISEKIKNYVTLPVNTSTTSIGESNQLNFNKKLEGFYDETVTEFNGILISTRNYRNRSNGELQNENSSKKDITINENYLKVNPIHDINKNIINESSLMKDKFNILIPQDVNENQIKELYSERYNFSSDNINIIKYLNGEKINTFNPYSSQNNNGLINDPIILMYNKNILKNQMLNYISGQYYFLKANTSNPYNEIKSTLIKCGIDGIILESPYITNVFNESISNIRLKLINDLVQLAIYIIGAFIILIYNSKVYMSIYNEDIAYRRLCGYNFLDTYKTVLIIQAIQLFVFLTFRFILNINMNYILILIISILEFIIFNIYAAKNQMKNILVIMKGDE